MLLSGGPGQAAIPLTRSFAELVEPLRSSYDIVAIDQRGTGDSGAVDCTLESLDEVARVRDQARRQARAVEHAGDREGPREPAPARSAWTS